MPHPRQHIVDLAEICRIKGIDRIVISPGSRSAPLIKAFLNAFGESCISIVDERSAAYFALGMALFTQKPVVLICTSGTALLNYAPALAEAYHQKVPLLALTADRPLEWIDQQENQTLKQSGIYSNYIRGSYVLPQVISTGDDLWYAHRMINEAIDLCSFDQKGPVHINIPLTEPLYEDLPGPSGNIRTIQQASPEITLRLPDELIREWESAGSILIIHGQDIPGTETARLLRSLADSSRIAVVAENIANVPGEGIISNSNLLLSKSRGNSPPYPELIIHSGGHVVSKALAGYLRRSPRLNCWRIGKDKGIIDTFRLATRTIPCPADAVYRALTSLGNQHPDSTYRENWLRLMTRAYELASEAFNRAPFSDLLVFHRIMNSIPPGSLLALGNSSIIRYSQLFPSGGKVKYYANRGVSGIDGCLSTAAGIAHASAQTTLAFTGDLGFLYDSNALWNRELPANLKIVLINNGGGGIFHILKGPSGDPGFNRFIVANHPANIHKLADAFGLDYFLVQEEQSLKSHWDQFIRDSARAALLEVRTDPGISAAAFRQLMDSSN